MSIRALKTKWKYLAAVAVTVTILVIAAPACLLRLTAGEGKNVQILDFEQGYSLKKIAAELEEKKIIRSARTFLLYARFHGYDARAKAGTYQLNDGMRVAEIMTKLVSGDTYVHRFAVPEGYSIYQIGELLESRGLFTKDNFLRQCFNRQLLNELEIEGRSVEGYLYPSTYDITPKMNEADVIRLMVEQFHKVYAQKFADRTKAAGISKKDIITLASMVEKEAVVASERPLISSVFFNRLKKGMPLQSDPTAVYGVRAFSGKVTRADILRSSPYNTYRINGLPPGPIGNPAGAAIEAVLNPSSTRYLYFVARKDGTHHFSATLDEHNRAVNFYLKSSAATMADDTRSVARIDNARKSPAGRR